VDLRAVELAALKPMTSLETDSDHSANSDLSGHICVFLWDYTLDSRVFVIQQVDHLLAQVYDRSI
jgi:hypothetical protein